jgi:hypothetical protein
MSEAGCMSSLLGYRRMQSIGRLRITAGVVAVALLSSCSSDRRSSMQSGPPAPCFRRRHSVVQKSVPILMELTARIDATDSVEIRAQ